MKILILTSSTGGGHDMRATSLADWTRHLSAREFGLEARIHHPLEKGHGLYRFGVELYNTIQKVKPVLHHVYYNYLELASMFRSKDRILGLHRFHAVLESFRPDVVVSVHGSLNHGFFQAAYDQLGRGRVRCVTYCGELHGGYGFSRHWVNPQSDLFIGAVRETCAAARRLGMARDRIWCGGFLLRPPFYDPPLSEEGRAKFIRHELRFDPNEPIILMPTSATGANYHLPILRSLNSINLNVQLVVLCGHSHGTLRAVRDMAHRMRRCRIQALPFSRRMHQLLQCADGVVARAGTGTTSEAILCGCPLIINGLGGIMPQEKITTQYCRKHGVAEVMHRPEDLGRILHHWLKDPRVRTEIRANMRKCRPRHHPLDILNRLKNLVSET
jgi:processive 1,2-diacylglycerol beta-glucosyltransferase